MNEVAKREQGAEESKQAQIDPNYSPSQLALIKRMYAPGATNDEFSVFIGVCKSTGLSPVKRQIYYIKRRQGGKDVGTFQVGIDGLRAIAERSGVYAGNNDPEFEYDNPLDPKVPVRATVTVKKFVAGAVCEFSASARWSEYCPAAGNDFMWKKMPHAMLGKTAEALALRKAFPGEMSGLYTNEEMDQAGGAAAPTQATVKQVAGNYKDNMNPPATNGKPAAKPQVTADEELPVIQQDDEEIDDTIDEEDIPK